MKSCPYCGKNILMMPCTVRLISNHWWVVEKHIINQPASPAQFALQGHDPKSIVRYKNVRVKRLE